MYGHLSPRQDSRVVDMRCFLTDLIEKVFQSFGTIRPDRIQVACEDIALSHHQALAIGIIAIELGTSCLKYAFPDDRAGHVVVALANGDGLELSVSDNGVGLPSAGNPARIGLAHHLAADPAT